MNSLVRHRGPDDEGYVLFSGSDVLQAKIFSGNDTPAAVFSTDLSYCPKQNTSPDYANESRIALGHRRLSIVDLSPAGHQPMSYQNGRFWIVYNGEIYNWKELRSELELFGHTFASHSDTEVILASYAQWGKECLHRFNGMWAFVIFDTQEQILFAARDRFGIKPLYYWFSPDGILALASEIKQFTILPGWSPILNHARAYDFLTQGLMDHTNETLFSDVFQLRGGQSFEVAISQIQKDLPVYQWYTLNFSGFPGSFEDATKEFQNLFIDSVKKHLRADVSVGSCLSGGLDSSSIVCVANDLLTSEGKREVQRTFSAVSDIRQYDESEFIEEIVKNRKIESYNTLPTLDYLFDILDDIIWYQDEPFGSTSIFAQWLVFDLAAQNDVKVMLDGQGADEQLMGYHNFFPYHHAELFAGRHWIKLTEEMRAVKEQFGYGYKRSITGIVNVILPAPLKKIVQMSLKDTPFRPKWLNYERLNTNGDIQYPDHGSIPLTSKLSYRQLFFTSLPLLLHWEDRDSMAHSVESRVPFLDYHLVEFVYNLPSEYKIQRGCTKNVLRRSMKGIIPEKIRRRMDKIGFVTAEEEWIRNRKPDLFRDQIRQAIEYSVGIINDEAQAKLERVIAGQDPFDFQIWRIICFGRWMKRYNIVV